MFSSIKATRQEVQRPLPGDTIISDADVIMDRVFTVNGRPDMVWPWLVQLGKNRAGWYFPRFIERFIPTRKRALWSIDPSFQSLSVGTVIDDWGGKDAMFEVAILDAPGALVYTSKRGKMNISWAIILFPVHDSTTRVQLRLRLASVKYKWLAHLGGGLIDMLTVAALAKGLNQRLAERS